MQPVRSASDFTCFSRLIRVLTFKRKHKAFTSNLILLEFIFGGLIEVILYGGLYWVGYLVLWTASLGGLRMAPFSTYGDENRKSKWYHLDWSIWLKRPGSAKALKAEMVCLAGLAAVMVALMVTAATLHSPSAPAPPPATPPASTMQTQS